MYTDGCYPYVGNAGCTSESPNDPGGLEPPRRHPRRLRVRPGGRRRRSHGDVRRAIPGSLTWTAEFGDPLGAVPNSETAFLNSSVSYPSGAPPHIVRLNPSTGGARFAHHGPGRLSVGRVGGRLRRLRLHGGAHGDERREPRRRDPRLCRRDRRAVEVVVAPDVSNAARLQCRSVPSSRAASATVRPPFVAMAVDPRRQRLLGGGVRRGRLHLRWRRLPRLDGRPAPERSGRRHGHHPRRRGLLARRRRRRGLRLRRRRLLRQRRRPETGQTRRRHGGHRRRQGLLAGGQ